MDQYQYTTVGEYKRTHEECTGELEDVNGEILDDDAQITVCGDEYCVGHDTANATWMPLI
jgi:hypothetical protein